MPQAVRLSAEGRQKMGDLMLNYRACGAECREDSLRMLANENGLPFGAVQRLAEKLGERQDFGELVHLCECGERAVQ
jgi:hypothetical protein|tara:strand:+ start:6910 stop:7140 length:231 start_codon:yes stop_codon:yes gene_type:complete